MRVVRVFVPCENALQLPVKYRLRTVEGHIIGGLLKATEVERDERERADRARPVCRVAKTQQPNLMIPVNRNKQRPRGFNSEIICFNPGEAHGMLAEKTVNRLHQRKFSDTPACFAFFVSQIEKPFLALIQNGMRGGLVDITAGAVPDIRDACRVPICVEQLVVPEAIAVRLKNFIGSIVCGKLVLHR